MTLAERDFEVLIDLQNACDQFLKLEAMGGWVRPLDCGGYNGSDHSYRLAKLARLGLAEQRQRSSWGTGARGSKRYRITPAGQTYIIEQNAKTDSV